MIGPAVVKGNAPQLMTLPVWLPNEAAVKAARSLLLEVHGLLQSSPDWSRTAFSSKTVGCAAAATQGTDNDFVEKDGATLPVGSSDH